MGVAFSKQGLSTAKHRKKLLEIAAAVPLLLGKLQPVGELPYSLSSYRCL